MSCELRIQFVFLCSVMLQAVVAMDGEASGALPRPRSHPSVTVLVPVVCLMHDDCPFARPRMVLRRGRSTTGGVPCQAGGDVHTATALSF